MFPTDAEHVSSRRIDIVDDDQERLLDGGPGTSGPFYQYLAAGGTPLEEDEIDERMGGRMRAPFQPSMPSHVIVVPDTPDSSFSAPDRHCFCVGPLACFWIRAVLVSILVLSAVGIGEFFAARDFVRRHEEGIYRNAAEVAIYWAEVVAMALPVLVAAMAAAAACGWKLGEWYDRRKARAGMLPSDLPRVNRPIDEEHVYF